MAQFLEGQLPQNGAQQMDRSILSLMSIPTFIHSRGDVKKSRFFA
jgi:hypothetical protein